MEDVPKVGEGEAPAPAETPSIPTLDGWIDNLMNCKQLAEDDVRKLCDKVGDIRACCQAKLIGSK